MRISLIFILIISIFSMLYKWRYKLLNMLLAVKALRKALVSVTMRMPSIKEKILPGLFSRTMNK